MCVSNEPGYYEDGKFGIRIENIIATVNTNDNFMGFNNLTLVPYCKKLLDMKLLS